MRHVQEARILIVDDQRELLALVQEGLRSAGYREIRTADSVRAARNALQADNPELVILDVNLPDGDGFSLFREIRAQSDVPVLFLSARDADGDRLFGLGLGADDYLTKPFLMQDRGAGYPETVLRRLAAEDAAGEAAGEDNAPHILGLHLVQQIVRAHGGSVRFDNAGGARAEIRLPIPGHAGGGTLSGTGSAGLP